MSTPNRETTESYETIDEVMEEIGGYEGIDVEADPDGFTVEFEEGVTYKVWTGKRIYLEERTPEYTGDGSPTLKQTLNNLGFEPSFTSLQHL